MKKPKRPQVTWADLRRQALDAAARAALTDPTSSDEVVEAATQHLESSAEITAAELAKLSPSALASIRSAMTGQPIANHAALVTAPAPVADQGDESDYQVVTAPEPVATQVSSPPQPKAPKPYSQTLPTKPAKDPGSKYLDDGPTIRQRNRDEVRRLKG